VTPDAPSRKPRRPGSFWWLFWAAIAVWGLFASEYFQGRERQYVEESARLRRQLESVDSVLAEWQQAPAILNGPGVLEATSPPLHPDGVSARIFVDPGHAVALVATRLPAAPSGQIYAMWLVRPNQPPVAAGVFQAQNDGSAIHVDRNAPTAVAGASVVVTLESSSNATQPSATPVLSITIP
jgi:hypothetical protein